MIAGVVLLVVALAARASSGNRHVRGRLLFSAIALALYAGAAAALAYVDLSPEMRAALALVQPLLLALGVITALVAAVVNPWREDRLPDRFPTIVQDSIVIALFALAATLVLQEKIFATTAVGAVVIGFALQDTLGNLFAGLAIQIEKPFRVGQWVNLDGKDGIVREITWRATKLRTKSGNFIIVPNSVLSKDTITNYSEPVADTRIEVEVSASYETPPNEVKSVILAALRDEPLQAPGHEPEVLIARFADSGIEYRIRVWTADFAADERLRDRVRSAVYYAFRRAAIEIPYPVQVQIERAEATRPNHAAADALAGVEIFAALDDKQRAALGGAAKRSLYAAGERVVRQGESGSSMFVVVRGEVAVVLEGGQEVARIAPGGFFGEMSLLTGAPRTATVRTTIDSELVEITSEAFREFVLANPTAVEEIGVAVAKRADELSAHRAAGAAPAAVEAPQTFLARVRKFLHVR